MVTSRRRTKAPKPLIKALEELNVPEELKGPAQDFLTKTDFSQLKSQADFDNVFGGLVCCQQLLGPLHIRYSQTLESMRKSLIWRYKAFLNAQRQWFEEDVQLVLFGPTGSAGAIFEEHKGRSVGDVWPRVKEVLMTLFEGPPPPRK